MTEPDPIDFVAAAMLGHLGVYLGELKHDDEFAAAVADALRKALADAGLTLIKPAPAMRLEYVPAPRVCCQACDIAIGLTGLRRRFIVCPTCGNKRCPKATYHDNACTGSNEPGQPGSSY
jgi:hypothetical protein